MSVLARVFEGAGLVTTAIATVKEHAERVRPPRALFVPYAFGFTLGRPDDPELQHRIIGAALDLLRAKAGPVLEEFQDEHVPGPLPQASNVEAPSGLPTRSVADEVTSLRIFYERWVAEHGGVTAVGLSGVPQRRFRGVVRFLEAYAAGEDPVMKEQPPDMPVEQFVRFCVDDLKAFYYEARMAQSPDAKESDIHKWLWGSTAAGELFRSIARRMENTPGLDYVAFGIAR